MRGLRRGKTSSRNWSICATRRSGLRSSFGAFDANIRWGATQPTQSMKGVQMKASKRLLWNVLSVLVVLHVSATELTAQKFEIPPTLPAQTLVPASLLSGPGFRVQQQVPTDGLMAHF